MNFLLDVDWRRLDHEIRPVLLIFASPNQLRVKVAIALCLLFFQSCRAARKHDVNGALFFLLQNRLVFGRGNILARSLVVHEGLNGFPK